MRMLRFNDVHCTLAILSIREETPTHRLGIYFLEIGYDICLSKLNYCYGDRVRFTSAQGTAWTPYGCAGGGANP